MVVGVYKIGTSAGASASTRLQGEHPLDVPAHGHQTPLASGLTGPRKEIWRDPITDLMIPNTAPPSACVRHNVIGLRASSADAPSHRPGQRARPSREIR